MVGKYDFVTNVARTWRFESLYVTINDHLLVIGGSVLLLDILRVVCIRKCTLSQIYPHSNWNSKLNTKLRLELGMAYRLIFTDIQYAFCQYPISDILYQLIPTDIRFPIFCPSRYPISDISSIANIRYLTNMILTDTDIRYLQKKLIYRRFRYIGYPICHP